jgi:fluoride ion exporter CrcB/FEX
VLANWRVAGLVFFGGAIGSMLRHVVHDWVASFYAYPTSEVISLGFINLLGSYFLGLVIRHPIFQSDYKQAFFATGLAGGFTTMSAITIFIVAEDLTSDIALMLFGAVITFAAGWHQGRRAARKKVAQ